MSLHPHGVQYGKDAEGAPYLDRSVGVDGDDYIEPGQEYTYNWCVPSSAGPGDSDGSSIVWLFHDHVHEINGTNAGLIGTLIVSSRDSANVVDAKPTDVDKEIVLLFASLNELSSLYVVFEREARESLFDSSFTHVTHSCNLHYSKYSPPRITISYHIHSLIKMRLEYYLSLILHLLMSLTRVTYTTQNTHPVSLSHITYIHS